ncbi:uncharacterized protein [Diabrotica undecimpunctata]|uniref:uncharacterized protein n=1 Tax=Diabrotica undecimpunctata TaxID=50387 RepID=UPI003B63E71B
MSNITLSYADSISTKIAMPFKRKRSTNKFSWTDDQMQAALKAIEERRYGLTEAARQFNIPVTTLQNRVSRGFYKGRLGANTLFSNEQEEEMSRHLLTLSKIFYGLTPIQLRKEAFAYAEKLNLKHSFNREKQEASKDWLYGFMSRHPELGFRKPEATSLNRIQGFNKDQVSRFYDNLGKLYDEYKFPPTRIFNVDETGITNVNRPNRIIGPRGQKQVGAVTSVERGKNVTVCCCMSASGSFTPPMTIHLSKTEKKSCFRKGWASRFFVLLFKKRLDELRSVPVLDSTFCENQ